MWALIVYVFSFYAVVLTEMTAPGIDRSLSDGVRSAGFKLLYGDKELTVINEVVSNMEKENTLKSKVNIYEELPPLPAEDVKCLMSVNRYCSKEMSEIKSVLINALKEDCKECTDNQREKAGKIVASMMAHDPVAWKMFLTRSALQLIPPKVIPKLENLRFKTLGEPEEVVRSKYRYMKPGYRVRVKRYAAEIIP